MVEWDDDEDDEIIENHHKYLNTDSAVAVEKATLENHATSVSRVASALKIDPSDMNVQEKMMKKLERVDAQGSRIAAQRIIRIQKDDSILILHVVSCRKSSNSEQPKIYLPKESKIFNF